MAVVSLPPFFFPTALGKGTRVHGWGRIKWGRMYECLPPLPDSSLGPRPNIFPLWAKFFVNYTVHWLVVKFKPRIATACSNPVTETDFLSDSSERGREKLFQSIQKYPFPPSRVIHPGRDRSRRSNYLVDTYKSCFLLPVIFSKRNIIVLL